MSARRCPFEDPGIGLVPPIISKRPDCVAEVVCVFFDGTDGTVQMRELNFGEKAGVFAALADPKEFAKAGIGFGAVMWANGLDLAPDAMYDEFRENGFWVLR